VLNLWRWPPRIRAATARDLARVKETTHPEVIQQYYAAFPQGTPTEFETQFSTQTFSAGDPRPNIQKVTGTRETPVQQPTSTWTDADEAELRELERMFGGE